MNKIKVSKEIGKALDLVIKSSGKKNALEAHTGIGCWTIKEYTPLNKLSNWEMAEILIYGYEVEEAPEEKIASEYKKAFMSGQVEKSEGMLKVLEILKIKIKGINT